MATTAVSKYRTAVRVSTAAAAADNITGITQADPCVVTATAHGMTTGTVVVLAGIGGMTELNGRAAVITAANTDTFTLGGIDSTGYTAYTSGGTATAQTMTLVENVTNFERQAEEAERFDATNLQSIAKEYITGLAGEGAITVSVDIDATGPGQERLRNLLGTDTAVAISVTRSDGRAGAMMVKWTGFSESYPDKHVGTFTGIVTGKAAWYA